MVEREAAHLVERDQDLDEELLVFGLQREREAVDDAAKDLQELANAVEVLRLVDEPAKSRSEVVQGCQIYVLVESHFKKKLLICLRMNALSPRNFP